jgi:hypothetical protein
MVIARLTNVAQRVAEVLLYLFLPWLYFIFVSWGGLRLSLLDTLDTIWPIVPAPDDRWHGKPKCWGQTCLSVALSTTNPTQNDLSLNRGLCAEEPTASCLNSGMAPPLAYSWTLKMDKWCSLGFCCATQRQSPSRRYSSWEWLNNGAETKEGGIYLWCSWKFQTSNIKISIQIWRWTELRTLCLCPYTGNTTHQYETAAPVNVLEGNTNTFCVHNWVTHYNQLMTMTLGATYRETRYESDSSDADLHTRTPGSSRKPGVSSKARHFLPSSVLTTELQTDTGDHGTPRHSTTPSINTFDVEKFIILRELS